MVQAMNPEGMPWTVQGTRHSSSRQTADRVCDVLGWVRKETDRGAKGHSNFSGLGTRQNRVAKDCLGSTRGRQVGGCRGIKGYTGYVSFERPTGELDRG